MLYFWQQALIGFLLPFTFHIYISSLTFRLFSRAHHWDLLCFFPFQVGCAQWQQLPVFTHLWLGPRWRPRAWFAQRGLLSVPGAHGRLVLHPAAFGSAIWGWAGTLWSFLHSYSYKELQYLLDVALYPIQITNLITSKR